MGATEIKHNQHGGNADRNFLKRLLSPSHHLKIKWINADYLEFQAMEIGFSEHKESLTTITDFFLCARHGTDVISM